MQADGSPALPPTSTFAGMLNSRVNPSLIDPFRFQVRMSLILLINLAFRNHPRMLRPQLKMQESTARSQNTYWCNRKRHQRIALRLITDCGITAKAS